MAFSTTLIFRALGANLGVATLHAPYAFYMVGPAAAVALLLCCLAAVVVSLRCFLALHRGLNHVRLALQQGRLRPKGASVSTVAELDAAIRAAAITCDDVHPTAKPGPRLAGQVSLDAAHDPFVAVSFFAGAGVPGALFRAFVDAVSFVNVFAALVLKLGAVVAVAAPAATQLAEVLRRGAVVGDESPVLGALAAVPSLPKETIGGVVGAVAFASYMLPSPVVQRRIRFVSDACMVAGHAGAVALLAFCVVMGPPAATVPEVAVTRAQQVSSVLVAFSVPMGFHIGMPAVIRIAGLERGAALQRRIMAAVACYITVLGTLGCLALGPMNRPQAVVMALSGFTQWLHVPALFPLALFVVLIPVWHILGVASDLSTALAAIFARHLPLGPDAGQYHSAIAGVVLLAAAVWAADTTRRPIGWAFVASFAMLHFLYVALYAVRTTQLQVLRRLPLGHSRRPATKLGVAQAVLLEKWYAVVAGVGFLCVVGTFIL